jgi:hypothetical protein
MGVYFHFIPGQAWQRVAVAALCIAPFVLVLILMAPSWVLLPFLPEKRAEILISFWHDLWDQFIKLMTAAIPKEQARGGGQPRRKERGEDKSA